MKLPLGNFSFTLAANDPDFIREGTSSAHTGGVHFLFCDGSVRFVSENIDHRRFGGPLGGATVPRALLDYLWFPDDGTVIGEF